MDLFFIIVKYSVLYRKYAFTIMDAFFEIRNNVSDFKFCQFYQENQTINAILMLSKVDITVLYLFKRQHGAHVN